ncbi:trimeric autotransporter adhesin [Pasteurella langaaensis DSM 22999]|uniref:Trimeric autotransporter adhesin n=1 Tax=Alitibacter langaaensis DSM 22999 TaxID=1122935 RepID=A0A2U0SKD5_9PAST|nr:left-handed beta-roll domain-containing protein [Pasteurella langaaensis]PVX31816.1 trimeric autotransporter adhesin [Pasteurella langaaensis DSM 22999]
MKTKNKKKLATSLLAMGTFFVGGVAQADSVVGTATGENATAIGTNSLATATGSIAIGQNTTAT